MSTLDFDAGHPPLGLRVGMSLDVPRALPLSSLREVLEQVDLFWLVASAVDDRAGEARLWRYRDRTEEFQMELRSMRLRRLHYGSPVDFLWEVFVGSGFIYGSIRGGLSVWQHWSRARSDHAVASTSVEAQKFLRSRLVVPGSVIGEEAIDGASQVLRSITSLDVESPELLGPEDDDDDESQ